MINLNRAFIRAYDRRPATPTTRSQAVERFQIPATSERLQAAGGQLLADVVHTLLESSPEPRGMILVRGACRAIGRTTVAIALAQTLATTNRSIALVDADLEHPSLSPLLLSEPSQFDWLADDDKPITDAAIESRENAFTLLPLRSSPVTSEIATSESVVTPTALCYASRQQLVHRAESRLCSLTEQFDLVIVDTNCWNNETPNAPLIRGDGVSLIVTDSRSSATSDWMPLVTRLRDLGERRIGRIENFSPPSHYSPSNAAPSPVQVKSWEDHVHV